MKLTDGWMDGWMAGWLDTWIARLFLLAQYHEKYGDEQSQTLQYGCMSKYLERV